MSDNKRGGARRSGRSSLGRKSRNTFVTKSGQSIRVNQSLVSRIKAYRDEKSRSRAKRLASLPKSRFKRFFYRLEPKRLYHYWFSREGGIMALKIIGIGLIVGFVLLVGVFAYFRKDLPNITDVSGSNLGGSISYYDRTGTILLWQDYDAVKRIPVADNSISNYAKQATIAVEDKDFYKHGGFDVRGIARAGISDLVTHKATQGGSTITQQLVKLTQNWTDNRTLTRKVKELILSVVLEREYSKQQILVGYLNVAPYGNVENGVEAGANDYFHKSAKDLTLDEAAFLAAIPKSPSYYSPYGVLYKQDPTQAAKDVIDRRNYIMDLMVEQNMILKKDADAAKKVDTIAKVHPQETKYAGIQAPYFALAAKGELEAKYGSQTVKRGGWKIITTLDMSLQKKAEELVAKNLPTARRYTGGVADEEATVTEDVQTGQIVALVGGTDFNDPDHGKINYAASSLIPPGSSFKPYDYVALINNNNNVGAGSVLYDSQGPLPGYPCTVKGLPPPKGKSNCLQDYDFLNPGPLTLRYALGGSRNIPAVKAMLSVVPNDSSDGKVNSINKTIGTASAMMANPYNPKPYQCYEQGVDINNATQADVTQCYGASAIGDGAFLHLDDHVNGLATLARMGTAIPRTYIMKITDSANKNLYEWQQPKGSQAVRSDAAYIVNDMASDPRASYLPGSCTDSSCTSLPSGYKFHRYKGWKFAIKTGTTNNGFDGLMTSWSTKYAVVSWVGNHTRNKNLGGPGMEYLTEPITRGMMEAAHANLKPVNWVQPSGIKSLPAFVVRNHIHYGDIEPSPTNDLFPSWFTGNNKKSSGPQTIDIVSNKLATECTPQRARKTVTNADSNSFSVDIFVGGGSASSGTGQATDDVHVCGEALPSITLTKSGNTLTATASPGAHPLSSDQYPMTINFIVNGQVVQSSNSNPATYNPAFSGDAEVTAQVIDSVLYDATSNSVTATGSGGGGGGPLTLNSAKISGGTTKFSWTGGSGVVSIFRNSDHGLLCGAAPSSNCQTGVPNAPFGTPVHAEDSSGNSSSTITVN